MLGVIRFCPKKTNRVGRFFWIPIWGTAAFILAFSPLILLNIAQLASLILLPFSFHYFRKINTYMAWIVWSWWTWGVRSLVGVKMHIKGDVLPKGETAVVIANHQGMSDILCLLCVAHDNEMKDAKFMSKNIIKYIPFFGWSLRFIDFIMLKRNWADDAQTIHQTFKRYCERRDPFWVFLFPEGTRIQNHKLKASQQYAAERGLEPTKHILLPRPRGFTASLSGLHSKLDAVYDATIFYGNKVPTILEIMRGDIEEVEVYVTRYPMAVIPSQAEEVASWLNTIFRKKDSLLTELFEKKNRL